MALADIPTPFPAAAFVDYDGKGIKLWRGTHGEPDWVEVLLSWAKVEKRIGELIAAGRYLNRAEQEQYASYQEQVAEQEARSKIHDDFYGIVCDYKAFVSESKIADKTPDRWYLVSCATAFLNGNKKCMPAPERGDFILPMMRDALRTIMETRLTAGGSVRGCAGRAEWPLPHRWNPPMTS